MSELFLIQNEANFTVIKRDFDSWFHKIWGKNVSNKPQTLIKHSRLIEIIFYSFITVLVIILTPTIIERLRLHIFSYKFPSKFHTLSYPCRISIYIILWLCRRFRCRFIQYVIYAVSFIKCTYLAFSYIQNIDAYYRYLLYRSTHLRL